MWSTRRVSVTSVASRHARLDVLMDGIRISRSASDAARRGTVPVRELAWDEVAGARVETTGKGRAVVRVEVRDVTSPRDHRDDPLAVKAGSGQEKDAAAVVALINEEAGTRRRWREIAEHRTDSAS